MTQIKENSDFKNYKNEFIPEGYEPEKFVVKKVSGTNSGYCVEADMMNIPGIGRPFFVPNECEFEPQEGMIAIYDCLGYVDADQAITFYTPEGKLVGGYKNVNGEKVIIKPNNKGDNNNVDVLGPEIREIIWGKGDKNDDGKGKKTDVDVLGPKLREIIWGKKEKK